ncbi:MAG TPA: DUF1598 domain-containing protein, partial [Planctomycetaceae bacterium]|nr:DUF1598 domain-containing protein [Planctomycetaceae bacterium]
MRDSRQKAIFRVRRTSAAPTVMAIGGFLCVLMVLLYVVAGREAGLSAPAAAVPPQLTSAEPIPQSGGPTTRPQIAAAPRGCDAPSLCQVAVRSDEEAKRGPRSEVGTIDVVDQNQREEDRRPPASSTQKVAGGPTGDADAAIARQKLIREQLEAGEFVAAMKTAEAARNPAERSRLIKMVVEAQIDAGVFDAALSALRRMPDEEQRSRVRQEITAQRSLAGGTLADFDSLINLIQNETSGPWEEIDGVGGTIDEFEQGIRVDPNGMLARLSREERTQRLKEIGATARVADLNEDVARPSQLRLVSLTRLEREVARRLADGQPVVETMKRLAGLYQVRYVFIYPDAQEILIGGPAEGWRYTETGVAVAKTSGAPTLQLDDLVTLLRTFSPAGQGIFGCSINPRQEGLRRLKAFVAQSQARGPLSAGAGVRAWVRQLQRRLGLQDIEIYGVPEESRVARVIVEADYRLKLIGIGKMRVPGVPSFFDLLTLEEQRAATMDALRWWLTMKYDAVLHSPERDVFEIQGASVLCRSENQFITDQGKQVQTGKTEGANRLFAETFTNHYAELARHDLVFAELQNVFDLALVAALL